MNRRIRRVRREKKRRLPICESSNEMIDWRFIINNHDDEKFLPPRLDPAKEQWPPEWKPIKESPQFKYGMINTFVNVWDLENYDSIPDSSFPPNCGQNIHSNLKAFLKQIRESRGYDVDYDVPDFVNSPFRSYSKEDVDNIEKKVPEYYGTMMKAMQFAFEEINFHAEMNGESYELLGMEKLVEAMLHRTSFLTFGVKKVSPNVGVKKSIQAMIFVQSGALVDQYRLIEWRFKPEATSIGMETCES